MLSFSSMLGMSVTPLSKVKPMDDFIGKPASKKYKSPFKWDRNTANKNVSKREQAIERYRKVMGNDWVKTRTIEKRLGFSRSVAFESLKRWLKAGGIVERRNAGDSFRFSRREGHEWRFIK